MTLKKMDCHAVTSRGCRRTQNEDQFLIADLVKAVQIQSTSLSYDDHAKVSGQSQGKVLLVADGMGGEAAGRRASTLAVDETITYMVNRMLWSTFGHPVGRDDQRRLSADLVTALKSCQGRIRDEAQWHAGKEGMGTTLTVAIVDWPALHVVHVGDSRCYIDHNNQLRQVTEDHTLTEVSVDLGVRADRQPLAPESAGTLWNVVGGPSAELDPKVYRDELLVGDTLLLCTDGLHKHVPDDEIADILRRRNSARDVCEELVARAISGGGSDNITVAVARFQKTTQSDSVIQEQASCETDAAAQGGASHQPVRERSAPADISPPVKVLPR